MCILIATTRHPDYPLILLSNRDEYFRRPTQPAHFRPLNEQDKILSPADLGRLENGTWIGITTTGRIAVLLNYRETDSNHSLSEISRGVLPLEYLCSTKSDEKWFSTLESTKSGKSIDLSKIGGFSLVFGTLAVDPDTGKINNLNIISNRGDHGKIFDSSIMNAKPQVNGNLVADPDHYDISVKDTFGISNSLYYNPWKKVKLGEDLLNELIDDSVEHEYDKRKIVDECFKVLTTDTFDKDTFKSHSFEKKFLELRNSIFIPPLETEFEDNEKNLTIGKYYGTRTQTVILLDKHGNLDYYERDMHNSDNVETDSEINQHFNFKISPGL
ncbi:NRDE protein-domain-containing protein [Scheffersomyces coipomensis]|uniref:NRDE protein-domain-containing protein n=1 Tax=Scheffersomyces coipomensis TaxID=1788519 RepID=UPI00315D5AA3